MHWKPYPLKLIQDKKWFKLLFTKYSIFKNFYSDMHTIIINFKDGKLTNFIHIFEVLEINIITANESSIK